MSKIVFVLPGGKKFGNLGADMPSACAVGRGNQCDLIVPLDFASRVHLLLRVDADGSLFVRDNDSKNGTYLNGAKVAASMPEGEATEMTISGGLPGERQVDPAVDRLQICDSSARAPMVKFEAAANEDDVRVFKVSFITRPKA